MSSHSDVKAIDYAADMLTYNSRKSSGAESSMKTERGKGARSNGAMAAPSIGPILRERREAMGVTLAEAEVATRIRQKYLSRLNRMNGTWCPVKSSAAVSCATMQPILGSSPRK